MSEPFFYEDRIKETTTTTGSGGVYALGGAVVGYKTFAGAFDGERCHYIIQDSGGNWESGLGSVAAGSPDTITRDSIYDSSNSGMAVNWSAGIKQIWCALTSSSVAPGEHAKEFAHQSLMLSGSTGDNTPTLLEQVQETTTSNVQRAALSGVVTAFAEDSPNIYMKGWEVKVLFSNDAVVGSVTKTVIGASGAASSWDISVGINAATGELEVSATGDATLLTNWRATFIRAQLY